MFNLWLYSGKLLSAEQLKEIIETIARFLFDSCFFADRREVPAMYSCAINGLIKILEGPDRSDTIPWIRRIWNSTVDNSSLRLLMIRVLVQNINLMSIMASESWYPYFSKKVIRDSVIAIHDRDKSRLIGNGDIISGKLAATIICMVRNIQAVRKIFLPPMRSCSRRISLLRTTHLKMMNLSWRGFITLRSHQSLGPTRRTLVRAAIYCQNMTSKPR